MAFEDYELKPDSTLPTSETIPAGSRVTILKARSGGYDSVTIDLALLTAAISNAWADLTGNPNDNTDLKAIFDNIYALIDASNSSNGVKRLVVPDETAMLNWSQAEAGDFAVRADLDGAVFQLQSTDTDAYNNPANWVRVAFPTDFNVQDAGDVVMTGAATGYVLSWNATTSTWYLAAPGGGSAVIGSDAEFAAGTSTVKTSSIKQVKDALALKVDKISPITPATKTKVTYNAQGQVTSGDVLSDSDIPALPQSKITNLTTDLAAKALDSAVVHKTGNETVDGIKTFLQTIVLPYLDQFKSVDSGTDKGGSFNLLNSFTERIRANFDAGVKRIGISADNEDDSGTYNVGFVVSEYDTDNIQIQGNISLTESFTFIIPKIKGSGGSYVLQFSDRSIGRIETQYYTGENTGTINTNTSDNTYVTRTVTGNFTLAVINARVGSKVRWDIIKNTASDVVITPPSNTTLDFGSYTLSGALNSEFTIELICYKLVSSTPYYKIRVNNVAASGGGGSPTGSAGGDLGGTYPNPTVAKLNGQLPSYYLSRANHTGTQAATTITGLATVATSGDYTDLSNKPTIPTSLPPNGSAGGELAGSYPNPTLSNSAVTGKVLTGYSASSGTISATDSILQAFNKVGDFIANIASTVRNTALTGLSTATATAVSATDSILVGIGKLQAQLGDLTSLTQLRKSSVTSALNDVYTQSYALGFFIYDDFNRSDLFSTSLWTRFGSGATISIVSNKLRMVGTGAATDYIQFERNSNLENYKMSFDLTPGSSSASFSIAHIGTNSLYLRNNLININLTGTGGQLRIYAPKPTLGSSPALVAESESGKNISFSSGDSMKVFVSFSKVTYSVTLVNTTNNQTLTLAHSLGTATADRDTYGDMTGIFKFGLYSISGTVDIDNFSVFSDEIRNPEIVIIGDSNTRGVGRNAIGERWPDQLQLESSRKIVVWAGSGDTTQSALDASDAIIAANPKEVWLNIGGNDIALSVSTGTWQANYLALTRKFQAAGIHVKHITPTLRTTSDVSALATYINSTFPATTIIDCTTGSVTTDSGNALDPNSNMSMLTDGTHLNQIGDLFVLNKVRNNRNARGFLATSGFSATVTSAVVNIKTWFAGDKFRVYITNYGTQVWILRNSSGTELGRVEVTIPSNVGVGMIFTDPARTKRYNFTHKNLGTDDHFIIGHQTLASTRVGIGMDNAVGMSLPAATLEVWAATADGSASAFVVRNAAGSAKFVIADQSGKLFLAAGVKFNVTNISANTTLDATHHYVFVTGNTTITIPLASANLGTQFAIMKQDTAGTTVTIAPTSGDNLHGSTSNYSLTTQFQAVRMIATSAGWRYL